MTLCATGLGVTDPPSVEGALGSFPLAHPVAKFGIGVGAAVGEIQNVSAMPGFANGIVQIQVRIPRSAAGR